MEEIEINNGRIVKKGDKILFYDEHPSFSWGNGFKIIESIEDGRVNAYSIDSECKSIASYGIGNLY